MNQKVSEYFVYFLIAVAAATIGVTLSNIFLTSEAVHHVQMNTTAELKCVEPEKVVNYFKELYSSIGYDIKNISVNNISYEGDICWYNITTYFTMFDITYRAKLSVPVIKDHIVFRAVNADNKKKLELQVLDFDVLFKPVKTERPKVELYIMSLCPFGTNAFEKIYTFYKDTKFFDVEPIFIVSSSDYNETACKEVGIWYNGKCYTSLHGKEELLIDVILYNIYRKHGFDEFSKVFSKFLEQMRNSSSEGLLEVYELFKKVLQEQGYNVNNYMDLSVLPILEQNTVQKGITASPTIYVNGVIIPYNPVHEPTKVYGAICASTNKNIPECSKYIEEIELIE